MAQNPGSGDFVNATAGCTTAGAGNCDGVSHSPFCAATVAFEEEINPLGATNNGLTFRATPSGVGPTYARPEIDCDGASHPTGNYGFFLGAPGQSVTDVSIIDFDIYGCDQSAIHVDLASDGTGVNTSRIEKCSLYNNNNGVNILGASNWFVNSNFIYNNSGNGVGINGAGPGDSADDNIVFGNQIYNNNKGVFSNAGGNATDIINNVIYNHGDSGIHVIGTTEIIHNTVYGNTGNEIELGGAGEPGVAMTVYNNIVDIAAGNYGVYVHPNFSSYTANNNLFYNRAGTGDVGYWGPGAQTCNTLINWRSPICTNGQELASAEADPQFVTPGSDFHLQAASPALGLGSMPLRGPHSTLRRMQGHKAPDGMLVQMNATKQAVTFLNSL